MQGREVITGREEIPDLNEPSSALVGFYQAFNQRSLSAMQTNWAQRMQRAHTNAVENLVISAPLVLMTTQLGLSSEKTVFACQLYFFARMGHFVLFSFGVPVLRIVAFLIGFYAQMILVATLFLYLVR